MRVAPLLTFADKAACCEARMMLRVQIKPRLERRKMDQGPIAPRRRGLSEWRSTTSGVQHLAVAVLPTSPGQCGGHPAHPLNGRNISQAPPRQVLTGRDRLVYKPATLTAGGRPLLWCGLEPALA